jgi:D-psicose/D-tagatose/L-ribulose 3-epimerase
VIEVGIHALVWAAGWSDEEARRALEETKRAGYDFIEIPLLDPTAVDGRSTARLLAEYDLGATCSLGLSVDADVSSEDVSIRARGEALLLDAVATTAAVGAAFLGGVVYSAMAKYLSPPTERGRSEAVETLRRVAASAAEVGVVIGVEPVNRYESNLLNTAEQALRFIDDVGAPNLVVHLDSYHMNIEEHDMASPVRLCRERLGYVHVGESHRGYLGTGSVDFPALFAALAEIEYDGRIAFESFSSVVVSEAFQTALALWRDPWVDGRDLALCAREFIADQLTASTNA